MGEAKRRRTEIIERRTFSIEQIAKMGHLFAWAGCTATVKGPLPRGLVSELLGRRSDQDFQQAPPRLEVQRRGSLPAARPGV